MNKNIFAVCDLEEEYARNFMNYLNQKKNLPFEIQAFSNVEALIRFGKQTHIELLLISGKALRSEIRDLGIGKIIILSEGNSVPEFDSYASVYKYQATSDVVREVMTFYGEEKSFLPAAYPVLKKSTEIIGVYSPVARCFKTSFALTLGQILAKKKEVLLVSLDGYSGFEDLMGKTFFHTMSDLFYYLKQENADVILRMNSMVQTLQGMDYIPPVQAPSDLADIRWEDMEKLLQEICLHSSYEVLILDIGTVFSDTFSLLERCGKVYMPVLEDPISLAKIRQFENLLKAWDYAQVLPKIEKLKLPVSLLPLAGDTYVEQLPFGVLGEFVKGLLCDSGKAAAFGNADGGW